MQGCIVLVVRRAMLLTAQTFRHRIVSERVLIKWDDQRKAGKSPVTEIGVWVGEIIRNGIGCTSIRA